MTALAAAIAVFTGGLSAIAIGYGTAKAADAISRQPEASGKIMGVAILGLSLAEATAIYGLLISFILSSKI